jgi:hypothetical protein
VSPRRVRPPRRGVALPAALGALALLSALALAGVAVGRDELRASQALAADVRARAAAEGAVAIELARWDPTRNLRLATGAADRSAPPVGADASVRTVRTALRTFLLDARASAPAGPLGAVRVATRRLRLLVRLRHLAPTLEGAIGTAGSLAVAAGARVSGADGAPEGWAECGAWGEVPADVAAVAVADADSMHAPPGVTLDRGVRATASAAGHDAYARFGEETWESLAARATVVIEEGAGPVSPAPREVAGACVADGASWGEPRRGAGAVAACTLASPVVHARGAELWLRGPARGQGVLLVDGDLRVEGELQYAGLVVVRGAVRAGAGALRLRGALMIANADGRGASELGPGSDVAYSSCAVARAAIAAARPVPVGRRAWSEVTR